MRKDTFALHQGKAGFNKILCFLAKFKAFP